MQGPYSNQPNGWYIVRQITVKLQFVELMSANYSTSSR